MKKLAIDLEIDEASTYQWQNQLAEERKQEQKLRVVS
jgi:hypothetical protein